MSAVYLRLGEQRHQSIREGYRGGHRSREHWRGAVNEGTDLGLSSPTESPYSAPLTAQWPAQQACASRTLVGALGLPCRITGRAEVDRKEVWYAK